MIVLTVVLVVIALAIIAVGAMGLTEKLPGNGVIGLRIPEVRRSPENWILGHKIAGPAWMAGGLAILTGALMTLRIQGWMWLVFGLLMVGGLFLIGMGSAMAASALARLEQLRAQQDEQAREAEGCCSSDSGGGCCSSEPAPAAEAAGAADAAGDACGCGSGGCGSAAPSEPAEAAQSMPALDLDAARRAAAAQDGR